MSKLLAIDDNDNQLKTLKQLIEKNFSDVEYHSASSGAEGLKMVEKYKPDIILLDILMPEVDGYEICRLLKNKSDTKLIPIVLLSSLKADIQDRIEAIKARADAILLKPVNELELVLQIKAMLKIADSNRLKEEQILRLEKEVKKRTKDLQKELEKYKEAVLELQKKEIFNVSLVQGSADILYVFSNSKGTTFWSNKIEEVLQYKPEDLINNPFIWTNSIHPEHQDIVKRAIQGINKEECFDIEYKIKDKSGHWHWFRDRCISLNKIEDEIVIQGLATDITAEKKAKRIQEENFNFLLTIIEKMPGRLWIADQNYRMLQCNSRFAKSYKTAFNKEINKGDDLLALVTGEEKEEWVDYYRRALKGENFKLERKRVYANSEIWNEYHFAPIRKFSDEKRAVLVLAFDITERKENSRKLKKNEKMLAELNATKDKFFSIIAHDLRSPFNSILGFSDLIYESCINQEFDQIELMSRMLNKAAKQSFDLLNNLLEWSRTQRGKSEFHPTRFLISDIINSTVNVLMLSANSKNIDIQKNIVDNFVYADYNMLETIIRNLVSNAIKYTHNGGEIKISAHEVPDGIQIEVIDNGIGINFENQQKLFKIGENISTFGTNNEKGTGLGLVLCNEFVKEHMGKIWFKSEPGKGSAFFVIIPKS